MSPCRSCWTRCAFPLTCFQLYLATTVVTNRFSVLLTTMNNLVLSLLGACAVGGLLTLRWGRLVRNGVITLVLLALSVGEPGPSLPHGGYHVSQG